MKRSYATRRTSVYVHRLPEGLSRSNRRGAETAAVEWIVKELFGADAVYSHFPDGAPFVAGVECALSVSHGGGMAMVAVSDAAAVGVDVEVWREQLRRVAPKFLTPREMDCYASSPEMLLRAWTAKEAVYKAARTPGLALSDIVMTGDAAAEACGEVYELTFFGEFPLSVAVAESAE